MIVSVEDGVVNYYYILLYKIIIHKIFLEFFLVYMGDISDLKVFFQKYFLRPYTLF